MCLYLGALFVSLYLYLYLPASTFRARHIKVKCSQVDAVEGLQKWVAGGFGKVGAGQETSFAPK